MAFQSASRFGYSITLPFTSARTYRIKSPDVEIGNFMIESSQLASDRVALTVQLAQVSDEYNALEENDPRRAVLQDQLEEATRDLEALADRLTVPDGMESDYFRSILGEAYDKMVENKEPIELVKLAASTVSVWVLSGREDAEEYWNAGGRHRNPPKAPRDHQGGRAKPKQGTSQ